MFLTVGRFPPGFFRHPADDNSNSLCHFVFLLVSLTPFFTLPHYLSLSFSIFFSVSLCFSLSLLVSLSLSEDEQRNSMSHQKSLQSVIMEKDSALGDLNSVERSLSDMFRRYENMKSTLEGFKKVCGVRAQRDSGVTSRAHGKNALCCCCCCAG